MPTKTRATTPKTTTPKANPSSRPSSSPGSSSSAPSGGGIDEFSYLVHKENLRGQQRQLDLQVEETKVQIGQERVRGYQAKLQEKTLWADKQEAKVQRQEVKLNTEQKRLEVDKLINAREDINIAGNQAYNQLHEAHWRVRLAKKAFKVSGDPSALIAMQQAGSGVAGMLGSGSSPSVDFSRSRKRETA